MPTVTVHSLVPRLERLEPVTLQPERFTERPAALRELQRIDSVAIRMTHKHEGRSQKTFGLEICFKQSRRRIPIIASRKVCSRLLTATISSTYAPDVIVNQDFTAIRRVRDAVYYAASKDHGPMPCVYCTAIYDFILLSSTTPSSAMLWLQTEATQCASLTKFLQQLVRLAVQVKATDGEMCSGQQRIPELVSEFLRLLTP